MIPRFSHRLRSGFTAIEVILTIGTVALAAGLSVPMYRQYIIRNDLEIARQNVAQGIQRAKFLSQMAMNDSQWGFSTDAVPGRGILFMGETYATRNPAFDEMYIIPTSISINGVTEMQFEKVTGEPLASGDIVLTALNGEQRTVTVSLGDDGNVTIPEDWIYVCVNPYGDSPTTMQVPDSLWIYYRDQGAAIGQCGAVDSCGNGIVEVGESCDGGAETEACNADCTTSICGDGVVNATAGEECDASGESVSCNINCTNHTIGDTVLNETAGEECDDGNTNNGDGCDENGQTEPTVGDGIVNGGEECDDGNTNNGDGCDSSGNNEVCGNNLVQSGEQCDDGNTTAGDGCSATCTNESGGGGGGGGGGVDPDPEDDDDEVDVDEDDDDEVDVDADYNCTLTVLAADLDLYGYEMNITLNSKGVSGGWNEPYGDWNKAVDGNINTDPLPDSVDCGSDYAASDNFRLKVASWVKKQSWYDGSANNHWQKHIYMSNAGNSDNAIVLENGDNIPSQTPLLNAGTLSSGLAGIVNLSTGKIELDTNDILFLFELGDSSPTISSDFQDLIILVDFEAR